jgi:DNA-binding transcriptional MocR family regulator
MDNEPSPIIVEDPAMRDGFTQIPNAILCNPDFTLGAKVAYGVLLSYAWQKDKCFPGHDAMAHDMGSSKRAVIQYLQQLQDAQLIRIQRRGQGKTNVYTILKLRSAESASLEVQESTQPEVQEMHRNKTQGRRPKKEDADFEFSKEPSPTFLRLKEREEMRAAIRKGRP